MLPDGVERQTWPLTPLNHWEMSPVSTASSICWWARGVKGQVGGSIPTGNNPPSMNGRRRVMGWDVLGCRPRVYWAADLTQPVWGWQVGCLVSPRGSGVLQKSLKYAFGFRLCLIYLFFMLGFMLFWWGSNGWMKMVCEWWKWICDGVNCNTVVCFVSKWANLVHSSWLTMGWAKIELAQLDTLLVNHKFCNPARPIIGWWTLNFVTWFDPPRVCGLVGWLT